MFEIAVLKVEEDEEVDEEVEGEVGVLWVFWMAVVAVAVVVEALSKLSGPQTVSRVWPYFQFSASCLLDTISDWKKKLKLQL